MLLLTAFLLAAAPPAAGDSAPPSTASKARAVVKDGGKIAEEPARDVGAVKTVIPDVLLAAQDDPYGMPSPKTCPAIGAEIDDLSAVLGPDVEVKATPHRNEAGHIAEAGGKTIVNSILPFRGLVREASGAAAADRRLAAAENAGFARRGFLHGIAASLRCPPPAKSVD